MQRNRRSCAQAILSFLHHLKTKEADEGGNGYDGAAPAAPLFLLLFMVQTGVTFMAASNKRLMKASEVPAFVDAIIKAGCDICAIAITDMCSGTSTCRRQNRKLSCRR